MAHLDFAGTMYESPISGVSSHLVLGKLVRMAGADIVVYPESFRQIPALAGTVHRDRTSFKQSLVPP